jgi:Rrf2 family protein
VAPPLASPGGVACRGSRQRKGVTMWISGTTQYAIKAVLYVAEHGDQRPVRVEEAARALDMPRNYLSKTLYALARAGILSSTRGPRGGFQLARPPQSLTLLDIARPFEDIEARRCLLGRPECGTGERCAVHARWEATSRALQNFFRETSVADLLAATTSRPAPPSSKAKGVARTKSKMNETGQVRKKGAAASAGGRRSGG